jgi:hypothetical protein
MKTWANILQIIGAAVLIAGVAIFNLILGVILGGIFLILFGIAMEIRGK